MNMNVQEAKEYADTRYKELTEEDSQNMLTRCDKVNIIIQELEKEKNFLVLTPSQPCYKVEGVSEDQYGIVFHI